jgi:RNA polymerase sigma-70 factor (ECF subfamily)
MDTTIRPFLTLPIIDFTRIPKNGRLKGRMLEESFQDLDNVKAVEKAFLEAYDEYVDALFRHCLLRIRDREIAKDIVQETFAKTWDYLSQGKKVDHLRAFLYRVANNLIVDTTRRKRSSSLDALMEDDGYEVADEHVANPADVPDARFAIKLLGSLDEMYRSVITMRFIDGLSPKEIASALSVSENVVSVRIHRGIERLKQLTQKPLSTP